MIPVTPKILVIGKTDIDWGGVAASLHQMGLDGAAWTQHRIGDHEASGSEALVEFMGRLCYGSFEVGHNPNVTRIREDTSKYLQNIVEVGHGSVLEHASVSFAFLNVSRVFTHELVRHRVGVAISQESLRYVRLQELKGYFPLPELEPGALDLEAGTLDHVSTVMENAFDRASEFYQELLALFAVIEGVDTFDDIKSFDKKKMYTSFARRVAPIGLATNIGWTANIRTLRHVIPMRTSVHAEAEIREVFGDVAIQCKQLFPNFFFDLEENSDGEWTTKNRT